MNRMPTLFISHGSPMLAIEQSPAHRFLQGLGKSLPRPKAILVASAHWEAMGAPAVSLAPRPETLHDFGGFSPKLYEIQYPANGAPDLAEAAAVLLEGAGVTVKRSATRGLDHGTWIPLHLMYPEADIPVAQISLVRGASPAAHEKIGAALGNLRDEGVLIIGSGSLTHNLHEFRGGSIDTAVPNWVSEFDEWMKDKLQVMDRSALLDYRSKAPHAARNHPTEEHLLPLFLAMGAAGAGSSARAERLHASYQYGVVAMDVYGFN
ncbi:class III extradiol ring-cleavage dioxygenase [soil metagenome]